MVRDEGRDAGRVGGAAGRGFGDAAEVPWRWFGGFRCAGRRFDSGARAGPWRGSAGHGGELSHLAFVKFTWSLPLLIIKQLTHEKGAGEHNLVPPGTAMCLGVA